MNNTNNSKEKYILFYSERCKMSTELRRILTNENILHYFEQHCVDGNINYYKQLGLTNVPTMIVPQVGKPLIAKDAFEWLQHRKFLMQQRSVESNRQIIQQSTNKYDQANNNNLLGFFKPEMGGFSDNYAFTNADVAQHQAFFGYKDEDNNAIYTSPEEKKKITKADFAKIGKNIENERKKQSADLKDFQHKQQIQDVIRSEIKKVMEK